MKSKIWILAIGILSLSLPLGSSLAQSSPTRLKPAAPANNDVPQQIARQIGLFFTNIQNSNIRHAYNELFKGTQKAADPELINDMVLMTENTITRFGNVDTHEIIETRTYGSHLLAISVLTRHKEKFYRWQFVYHSANGDDWQLNNMAVDDMRAFFPAYPILQPPPADVQIKIEKFFLSVQNRATTVAFNELTKGSPIEHSTEQLHAFAAKTNLALDAYGAMKNYELFDNRPLGKSMRLLTYLSAFEQQTLRWQFIFTVGDDGKWTLLTLRMDDQIVAGIINSN